MIDRNLLGSASMLRIADFIGGDIDYSTCGITSACLRRLYIDYESVSWRAIQTCQTTEVDDAHLAYLKKILECKNG